MITGHLVEEKHTFSQKYLDHQGREQTASVYLCIDYRTKEFKVLPGDGRVEFGFVTGSHKHELWQATVSCMKAAMDFAVQALHAPEPEAEPEKSQDTADEPRKVYGKLWATLPKRARRGIVEGVAAKLDIRKVQDESYEDWYNSVLKMLTTKHLEKVTYKDYSRVRNVGVDTLNEINLFYQKMKLVLK